MTAQANLSDLSKRFLLVIDKMGYSHYKIAKETKAISNSILTHIKNGRSDPSIRVICALLEKFPNIDANWLLTGKGPMFLEGNNSVMVSEAKIIQGDENNNSDHLKTLLAAKDKIIAIAENITAQNQKIIDYFERQNIAEALKKAKEEINDDINKIKGD